MRLGTWGLDKNANEATDGFLLNSFLLNGLITELLPAKDGERPITNSDPITGQAAWYDLKVRIYPAEEKGVWPVFPPTNFSAKQKDTEVLRYQTHKAVNLKRSFADILNRGEK